MASLYWQIIFGLKHQFFIEQVYLVYWFAQQNLDIWVQQASK